ncbi:MAG: hypothetical protein U1E52_05055 [Geminicoccaceae bacterium]
MDLRMLVFATSLLAAPGVAVHADELSPIAARTFAAGPVSGTAYYTVEKDGYRVVATLSAGEDAQPLRVEATLAPGQNITVSTPREVGVAPDRVEIARENDTLVVRQPALTN